MTEPLALLLYDAMVPGSQLIDRLQGLNYRIQTLNDADQLSRQAEAAKPMIVLADLAPRPEQVCAAISQLKGQPATAHIPVIVFSAQHDAAQLDKARAAGATLAVTGAAILQHLPQLLDQALMQF